MLVVKVFCLNWYVNKRTFTCYSIAGGTGVAPVVTVEAEAAQYKILIWKLLI
jgi:hypothetical protein